jgi:hypothetical protein
MSALFSRAAPRSTRAISCSGRDYSGAVRKLQRKKSWSRRALAAVAPVVFAVFGYNMRTNYRWGRLGGVPG